MIFICENQKHQLENSIFDVKFHVLSNMCSLIIRVQRKRRMDKKKKKRARVSVKTMMFDLLDKLGDSEEEEARVDGRASSKPL